jgi:hypothetical protein
VPPPDPQPKPEPEQKPPRKPINWNFLPILLGEIAGLILIFLVFLGVLNYFRIISLSNYISTKLPQATQAVTPTYDSKLGLWTIKGTFYQYNNEKIKIKTGFLKTVDFVYKTDSMFLKSNLTVIDAKPSGIQAGTLFDLDQKENLGKTVKVEYKIENKINYISSIILYK